MAGDCNRQIRLCSNSWRASCGFIFYDNIKLNPSLDGIEARGGVGLAGDQAGGLPGNQHKVVGIKNIRPHNKNAVSQRKCQASKAGEERAGGARHGRGRG